MDTPDARDIAFLGLGAMGARMAGRLVAAGHRVRVWNRSPGPLAALVAAGAVAAETPRAAATGAEFAISMVTDDDAARAVWLDPATGAAGGLAAGALAIEASTVTAGWVRELAAALGARGIGTLDAPVAGSRPQAAAGQLIFMAGGSAADLERARPVLAAMGSDVKHAGPVGRGATLKLAVNTFFAAQLASMAELLGFLAKSGIEPTRAAELFAAFPVFSPAIANAGRMMAARDPTPLFALDLLAKDLGYALAAAAEAGAALPGTEATAALFGRAREAGYGGDNVAGLGKLFF